MNLFIRSSSSAAVVPYVGTWIEIPVNLPLLLNSDGRSLRGNVDRNTMVMILPRLVDCRSLRGNVDRNDFDLDNGIIKFGRSLRGNVDRNA